MIAPFGLPHECRPGELVMPVERVMGVHLTLLKADGSGKAGTGRDKIMIGPSSGWPIVLASPNDVGGLAITEGIRMACRCIGRRAWAPGQRAVQTGCLRSLMSSPTLLRP